jgi:heme o synthase
MKASISTIVEPPVPAIPQPSVAERLLVEKSVFALFSELVKARLTALVIITTLVGFYAGSSSPVNYWKMFHAVVGTALLACGAAALNQLLERNLDARMRRTEDRPLPSGRLTPDAVLMIGVGLSIFGLFDLTIFVNPLTGLLGAATRAS